jgi:hypothetical protein
MQSAQVYDEVRGYDSWYTHNKITERTIAFHDSRGAQHAYNERPMTDSELALCKFADPGFGNFNESRRRVEVYLQSAGFGALRQNAEPCRALQLRGLGQR